MERIWNYFFYSTWKLLKRTGEIFIENPLIYIFNLVPYLRKNWNKGKKGYKQVMHSKDYGFNIGFAFSFMFLTTVVIYTSICLYLVKLLNIEVGNTIYNYFLGVIALSYLTNYFFLYRSDTYKKYFNEFDTEYKKKQKIKLSTCCLISPWSIFVWCFVSILDSRF